MHASTMYIDAAVQPPAAERSVMRAQAPVAAPPDDAGREMSSKVKALPLRATAPPNVWGDASEGRAVSVLGRV